MNSSLRKIVWLLILLALAVRWKLFGSYAVMSGYDAYSHLDYLERAKSGVWPVANQFWQGYQPPGYYFLSAWLATLFKASVAPVAQIVSLVCSSLVALPTYFLARRLVPGWEAVSVLFILCLPNALMLAPMVYGLPLALLMMGLFMMLLSNVWDAKPEPIREGFLGVLLALTCCIRVDGLMLGLPVIILWLRRLRNCPATSDRLAATAVAVMTGMVTLALISPFLLRNLARYDSMLITNRHAAIFPNSLGEINLPGFIPPTMIFNPGLGIWRTPTSHHLESLPGTLFVDCWGGRYPATFPGQIMLAAGLCYSLITIWGLVLSRGQREWGPLWFVGLANLVLLSVVIAEMKDYSAFKACYFYGNYYLGAVAFAVGVRQIVAKFGNLAGGMSIGVPAVVFLAAYCGVSP